MTEWEKRILICGWAIILLLILALFFTFADIAVEVISHMHEMTEETWADVIYNLTLH